MGAESARHNWLWWLDLRADSRFLTNYEDQGLSRALASFGVNLMVVGAQPLRSDELFDGGIIRIPEMRRDGPRDPLVTELRGLRARLRDGAIVCVVHDAAARSMGLGQVWRGVSLASTQRKLARLGVQELRAIRLEPAGTRSRVVVPDAKVAWSAFLELDEGLTHVKRSRATISRLGARGLLLPSWVLVGRI